MIGAQALVGSLAGAGVDVCFMNPGTSEMHFVSALDSVPEMRGVLALFEGVATGAADGYARIAGQPAAVTGLVIEAMRNRVPGRIGGPPIAIAPAAVICVSSPVATAATTPGASPRATAASTMSASLSPSAISSAYDRAVTAGGSS